MSAMCTSTRASATANPRSRTVTDSDKPMRSRSRAYIGGTAPFSPTTMVRADTSGGEATTCAPDTISALLAGTMRTIGVPGGIATIFVPPLYVSVTVLIGPFATRDTVAFVIDDIFGATTVPFVIADL